MSVGKRSLPDFSNPPVVEVALAVQFETLSALRTPRMGVFWSELRDRFPRTEDQVPLGPVIETFDKPGPPKPRVEIRTLDAPPVARCWFLNEQGNEVIQVQQDRFAHNWRKVGDADEYPRYERVRKTFETELARFQAFLARESLGEVVHNQCEITYVNLVLSGKGWDIHGQLGNVLTVFASRYSDEFLREPEDVALTLRYRICDENNKPIGRLHVSVDSVFTREDLLPAFLIRLTARGTPQGEGISGVLKFLDLGRKWIVRGFTSITTEQMHRVWERNDGR